MKDNDFEPARIISGPDVKQKEGSDPKTPTDVIGREPVPLAEKAQAGPSTQEDTHGASLEGILDRFTGKSKGSVIWASPYDMSQNGAFDGLYKSTVDKVASDIKG